jgi:hypothetical protein
MFVMVRGAPAKACWNHTRSGLFRRNPAPGDGERVVSGLANNEEVGRFSFPNSCLGTLIAETPVSVRRETGVSQTDVPKQEFGNEKADRLIASEGSDASLTPADP